MLLSLTICSLSHSLFRHRMLRGGLAPVASNHISFTPRPPSPPSSLTHDAFDFPLPCFELDAPSSPIESSESLFSCAELSSPLSSPLPSESCRSVAREGPRVAVETSSSLVPFPFESEEFIWRSEEKAERSGADGVEERRAEFVERGLVGRWEGRDAGR